MLMLALSLYFIDIIFWLICKQWLMQSFFAFILISWFATKKSTRTHKKLIWLCVGLVMQNTIRYQNFLVALAVTVTIVFGLQAISNHFDTTKSMYAYLFLVGFYITELFFVKKLILGLSDGGYFTVEAFLVTMIAMSILMGIRGNRPTLFN